MINSDGWWWRVWWCVLFEMAVVVGIAFSNVSGGRGV